MVYLKIKSLSITAETLIPPSSAAVAFVNRRARRLVQVGLDAYSKELRANCKVEEFQMGLQMDIVMKSLVRVSKRSHWGRIFSISVALSLLSLIKTGSSTKQICPGRNASGSKPRSAEDAMEGSRWMVKASLDCRKILYKIPNYNYP